GGGGVGGLGGAAAGEEFHRRESRRDPGETGANHPSADVGGEAFARASQVDGEDAGKIVAPEAKLGDGEEAREKHSNKGEHEVLSRGKSEDKWHDDEARDQEQAEQGSPTDDDHRQEGEQKSAGQAA